MFLGAHMSIAGGIDQAIARGLSIGCTAIQVFTKNANQWKAKPLGDDDIARFKAAWKQAGRLPMIAHDSYLINLGTSDKALWAKSVRAFQEELERCEALGIPYLVTHSGAHVGAGEEVGLKNIARALDAVHRNLRGYWVKALLEITAGQGTSLCYRFEHLATILDLVKEPERLGVCFDTCHAHAAGYELRTPEGYAETFAQFHKLIGLKRLKVFHFNDSVKDLGSRVDRHAHIGKGTLGLEPFRMILNDTRFKRVPMILETPKGPDMKEDVENLRVLKGLWRPY